MKKNNIKQQTFLLGELDLLNISYTNKTNVYYLGVKKISDVSQNTFLRTFFTFGHKIEENEQDGFGIIYKRHTESFIYKFLNHISLAISEIKIFDKSNKEIKFVIEPAEHNRLKMLTFFKISFTDDENYIIIQEKLRLINATICKYVDNNREELNIMLNSCIDGNIPLLNEFITITDENNFPYFSYELSLFLNDENNLSVSSKLFSDNIYKIEKLTNFIDARKRKIENLNALLKKDISPYEAHKQGSTIRFDSFFNSIDIKKTLEISKKENKNRVFNDENPIFKINEEYQDLEGCISLETFFELKENIKSPTKMYNFIKALEKI